MHFMYGTLLSFFRRRRRWWLSSYFERMCVSLSCVTDESSRRRHQWGRCATEQSSVCRRQPSPWPNSYYSGMPSASVDSEHAWTLHLNAGTPLRHFLSIQLLFPTAHHFAPFRAKINKQKWCSKYTKMRLRPTRLGELTALPRLSSWFSRGCFATGEGGEEREGEGTFPHFFFL